MYYIYQKSDGYIGCTRNPSRRWKGENLSILFQTEDIVEASIMEQSLQLLLLGNADNHFYHLHGNNEEACKKKSEAKTGKTFSEEHCKKISEAKTGKTRSEETCKKISEARLGRTHSEETCKKISEMITGRSLSEEHCKKMSKARSGKIWINNSLHNKIVKPEELEKYLSEGWHKGMKTF